MRKTHQQLDRLPPLRAVKAFIIAARDSSLTRAAAELGVTQGAVSRQIQLLEADLGLALFERHGRRMTLTAEGRSFAEQATEIFERLRQASFEVRARKAKNVLTVTMLPSVAAKWLAPRLTAFVDRYPEIDLRIAASRGIVDLEREGFDAAIRYGRGAWRAVNAELLAGEDVLPVCSPQLAKQHRLQHPNDLERVSLLRGDIAEDWDAWFRTAGIKSKAKLGPHFSDDTALIQAAIDGAGVALGRSVLVSPDLKAGRLLAPFETRLRANFAYWLATPAGRQPSDALIVLRAWLLREFRKSRRQVTNAPIAL